MRKILVFSFFVVLICLLGSCYGKPVRHVIVEAEQADGYTENAMEYAEKDSFQHTVPYGENYNFVVHSDSLVLISDNATSLVESLGADSFSLSQGEHIVVADIRVVPADSVDSVWVQVANEQAKFGWINERNLLDNAVPDDPISQFVKILTDANAPFIFIVSLLLCVAFVVLGATKPDIFIIHLRDIDNFYPSLLCLMVSFVAVVYGTIQTFAPESWLNFYFHPTLNPFSVNGLLCLFLSAVWSIIIIFIATIDVIFKRLNLSEALVYTASVLAMCIVGYIFFLFSTLYYIGYLLFAFYAFFVILRFINRHFSPYRCGNCNAKLRRKGRCPKCGAIND